MRTGEVILHRVRARCSDETEPLHARLRLAHLLATADFQPGRLPPNAILLLRRLRVPRSLPLSGARVSAAWEQALRQEIDRQAQHAVRPLRGRVPAGADAVLFADLAELLACLGVLAASPSLEGFWVWQSAPGARGTAPEGESLARLWRDSPRFVPAALRHLEAWDEAEAALGTLTDRQRESLFAVVAAEFGLPVIPADLWRESSLETASEPEQEDTNLSRVEESGERHAAHDETRIASTLPPWLPERITAWRGLSQSAQRLLALAHVITRSSSQVECLAALGAIRSGRPPVVSRLDAGPARIGGNRALMRFENEAEPNLQQVTDVAAQERIVLPDTDRTPPAIDSSGVLPPEPGSEEERAKGADALPSHTLGETSTPSDNAVEAKQAAVWDGLTGISTRFAGVFYLLNLLLRLDAPACFDAEFALSEHVTAWGVLEGFGRALLEETGEDAAHDTLWSLLAQMDGRQPETPIASKLPDRERRLAQVYARLRDALDELLGEADLRDLLCVRGTVYITRIHVDLVMALDSIWLPARRVGLDVSPAWCPELLRVVLFHFV